MDRSYESTLVTAKSVATAKNDVAGLIAVAHAEARVASDLAMAAANIAQVEANTEIVKANMAEVEARTRLCDAQTAEIDVRTRGWLPQDQQRLAQRRHDYFERAAAMPPNDLKRAHDAQVNARAADAEQTPDGGK